LIFFSEYIYEFNTVADHNYNNKDPKIQSIKQVVHPQPDALFESKATPKRTCLGDEMTLPVKLMGTAPFTLVWIYDKQVFSDMVSSSRYEIALPRFEIAGRHIASLAKVCSSWRN
jgi:nucleoporin POM152